MVSLLQGVLCYAQSGVETAESVLLDNCAHIVEAGKLFNVSPRLIASVIYVENARNVSWMDRDIDPLLADYGLNVSLGLGQVKINTAKWIEEELCDSSSEYYLGEPSNGRIQRSRSRQELVKRLVEPESNVCYVAALLAMIDRRWTEAGVPIGNEVDILATLYSAGVVGDDRMEKRKPHANPRSNEFGRIALEFFNSSEMLDCLPR